MTVTYTAEVATCRGFGCFLKLLFRWRGSIYKLVWLDSVAFLLIYYILNIVYRVVLNEQQKQLFEGIVKYCAAYSNLIPLSFVLGFYVSIVMTRWWNQYTSIPWPDPLAVFVSAHIHGQDERGRLMRRTVMRYVCLCLTMVLTNISPKVKKRFPSLQHLVDTGLLVENEKYVMESLNSRFPRHSKHWMPIVWASSIVTRARKEGRIRDDFAVKTIIDELNKFRGQAGTLIQYDTISVPLVYTQVVTLAVYSFFITSVMGQQWVENKTIEEGFINMIDLYFPIFTTLQFFFYMGWLKVAESLINPFGEDDDDFEVNWIIDRNLQVSYMIVDEMHHEHPQLIRDQYWDEIFPSELPYTVDTAQFKEEHPEPSTAKIEAPRASTAAISARASSYKDVDEMVGKSSLSVNYKFPDFDCEMDDDASGIHFSATGRESFREGPGSTNSLSSIRAGSMKRTNTVTSALKRFFSREDSRTNVSTPDAQISHKLPGSVSSNSLAQSKYPAAGSVRLADQIIEEVDEQLTITSVRPPETRPNVQSIFYPPPTRSEPIDVPTSNRNVYNRTQSAQGYIDTPTLFPVDKKVFLSTSAPVDHQMQTPTGSIPEEFSTKTNIPHKEGAGQNEGDSDYFEKLRITREKERLERQKQKIVRTISTQPSGGNIIDTELLLQTLESRSEDDVTSYTDSKV